ELASAVGLERGHDARADEFHGLHVPGPTPHVPAAPLEDEAVVRSPRLLERTAHDLPARFGPQVAVALDGVAWLRARVRAVHDTHEVRRGRDEAELDRAVVQGAHAD